MSEGRARDDARSRTFMRGWSKRRASQRNSGPAPSEPTEADEQLEDLAWEDLIARGYGVLLNDPLLRLVKHVASGWSVSPAEAIARALYVGLSVLLGVKMQPQALPYVEEWFQDVEAGAFGNLEGTWEGDEEHDGEPELMSIIHNSEIPNLVREHYHDGDGKKHRL